jgi:hypothetical protein
MVVEECGCATIDIICCEEPMVNLGPAKPQKVQPIAASKKHQTEKKAKTPNKPGDKKKVAKQPAKKATKKPAKKISGKTALKKARK